MALIREPAVAGQFYSGNAEELSTTVATLLEEAQEQDTPAPKALIVPHAGYIYSGPVAANAYARLRPYRSQYQRVILLGPCHRTPLRGLALSSADAYRMPMGDVPLDQAAIADLDIPGVRVFDAAHQNEHSLEVHLPFLQTVLGKFSVVPIVVGDASPELVSQVLDALWGGPETLILISSDLSHYLKYDEARAIDAVTCQAIEEFDAGQINHDMACGATPVAGLLIAAQRRGMKVTTLDLRNSADTAGDRMSVVGYGAWMFA
ncbi:MAG: AmmeMemoRadiSam system protein B [Gammaproteobacteria bacterium]|nr:AmmeMemoRadiSam system protein B [Gammaproteobacteria bacterium]MBT8110337.1 AmmeMemoRadiSam system protein B [Gammaproteobacteria bacterium]NND47684.1 AmmeMemoRadiSam system protein B [Woeseiaceae bacterium]NNL45040.1 AmmeMemoRadiSam system protein B [Woeseiaceae bacterium]